MSDNLEPKKLNRGHGSGLAYRGLRVTQLRLRSGQILSHRRKRSVGSGILTGTAIGFFLRLRGLRFRNGAFIRVLTIIGLTFVLLCCDVHSQGVLPSASGQIKARSLDLNTRNVGCGKGLAVRSGACAAGKDAAHISDALARTFAYD